MQNSILAIAFSFLAINIYLCYESVNTLQNVQNQVDRLGAEYQMIVTDSNITVFDYGRLVGTVRLEGQLNELITSDNL